MVSTKSNTKSYSKSGHLDVSYYAAPVSFFHLKYKFNDIKFDAWVYNISRQKSNMWVIVNKKHYFTFERMRKHQVKVKVFDNPILDGDALRDIKSNTIDFLSEYKDDFKLHNIPMKRGLLFCGRPGCGKTFACKWLAAECGKEGIGFKSTSMGDIDISKICKTLKDTKGVLVFDDIELLVKDRDNSSLNTSLYALLGALDGVTEVEGLVYIFTTNDYKLLDKGFIRPGRIDMIFHFDLPDERMRGLFVDKFFTIKISEDEKEKIINKSEGWTFADIEELRKLIAIDRIAGNNNSLDKLFMDYDSYRSVERSKEKKLGFSG